MKKRIVMITCLCLFILLNGCVSDPPTYFFEYEKLKGQIASVELINYEIDNPEIIKDASEVMPFDFNKEEVIETLDADKIDDFAIDLSEMRFLINWKSADAPVGICIKITCANSEFIIISWTLIHDDGYCFVEIFNSQGDLIKHIGWVENRKDYVALVNKYFEYKIK